MVCVCVRWDGNKAWLKVWERQIALLRLYMPNRIQGELPFD
jgi:hypothetical protein